MKKKADNFHYRPFTTQLYLMKTKRFLVLVQLHDKQYQF